MQLSILAAVVAGLATASAKVHGHNHHQHLHAGSFAKRQSTPSLSSSCASKLQSIGLGSLGINAQSAGSSGVWIGGDGLYTNLYNNTAPHEVCLVVWGDQPIYQASFVNVIQPLITVSLPPNGGTITLSFADGQSGAWAGVYPETVLNNGQISNTWGEFTMSSMGAVDISREVFSQGRPMRIDTPSCLTDMETCVFQCVDPSVTQCGTFGSYTLLNCGAGSQAGAQASPDNTSGGCGWMGASTPVQMKTRFAA